MGQFHAPVPLNEPVLEYREGSSEKKTLCEEISRQKAKPIQVFPIVDGKRIESNTPPQKLACPHNHELSLGSAHLADLTTVKNAIASCTRVQRDWAQTPWEQRAAVFLKAADLLTERYRPRLNAATMLGQSKTVHQAEIDAVCELIDFFRFNVKYLEEIMSDQPVSSRGIWNRTEARGLEGFVFAVTPFNFSSIAINLPTAPALMGCTAIWKPAATALQSAYWGMKMLEEAGLPEGVINFIPGEPQLVAQTCLSSPDLAGVHFTGSTSVFNGIWAEIGKNIGSMKAYPRIVGETGGKDFVMAHPDCDIEALQAALIRGAFEYQGQKCSAASRAYIPRSVWQEIRGPLVEKVSAIKMGDPENFSNFMGAVIDDRAFKRIEATIERAKKSDLADVVAGGECDRTRGYFIRPTLIVAKDPHYESMVEEIFGPVLTVYVYEDKDLDRTLNLVDSSTAYALTGAIFARRRADIVKMAEHLRYAAGNFYINDKPTGAVVGQQPFGGGRKSGTNDKAGSRLNLERWMSLRTVKETFVHPHHYEYPFMDCKK